MIFLSHNSRDKAAIRELAKALELQGVSYWLDERELVPGLTWQNRLEEGIKDSTVVAVCIGPSGIGPWQEEEMFAALAMGVREKKPVVPVILPTVEGQPSLPLFLANRMWVDLRPAISAEAVSRLVRSIPNAEPQPEAQAHLMVEELARMSSLVQNYQRSQGTLVELPTVARMVASALGVVLAQVIDPQILDVMERNIAKAKDRLKRALEDPANTQQAKDDELDVAKSKICAELRRIRELNQDLLPEGMEPIWLSFRCR